MSNRLPPDMRGATPPEPKYEPHTRYQAPSTDAPKRSWQAEINTLPFDQTDAKGVGVGRLVVSVEDHPEKGSYTIVLRRYDYDQRLTYEAGQHFDDALLTSDAVHNSRLIAEMAENADRALVDKINDDRIDKGMDEMVRSINVPAGPLKPRLDWYGITHNAQAVNAGVISKETFRAITNNS